MAKSKLELTEADARRLAFAQHLIMRAQEDARLPSPLNAAAVLSAQDAVEMVLIVISQTLDLDPNKYKFMAFWEAFAKRGIELPEIPLPGSETSGYPEKPDDKKPRGYPDPCILSRGRLP